MESQAMHPLRSVFANPPARRLALAFAIFNGAEYASWIALMVLAFQQGGATEAGIVAVAQLLPAAALAPFAGLAAVRGHPVRLLVVGYWTQSLGLGLAALTLALDGPTVLAYACVGITTVAVSTTRPAQALVTPALARRADELVAINSVAEWSAQGAVFVAPAIAGVFLAVSGPALVFAVFGALLALGALIASGLPRDSHPPAPTESPPRWSTVGRSVRQALIAPAVRLVLGINATTFAVVGAIDILIVTLAIDRLGGGGASAAWFTAAMGLGGIFGGSVSGHLVGRRLAPALAVATLTFGAAIAMVGLLPHVAVAVVMFTIVGASQVIATITTSSLLQRCAPSETVGQVFAVREVLYCLGLAFGSMVAPLLIEATDVRIAFVITGSLLPAVLVIRFAAIWRLDHAATVPIVELALLRIVPIFAGLPAPTLEGLARSAAPVDFARGAFLMHEGDPGDKFYALTDGEVAISRDGRLLAHRTRGDGVGETALMLEVPRTATVQATSTVHALALTKADFLIAVTGHAPTNALAGALAEQRVTETRDSKEPDPPDPPAG